MVAERKQAVESSIVIGLVFVVVAVVFLAAVGMNTRPRAVDSRVRHRTERGLVNDAGYLDDEGWIPNDTGPIVGYALVSQGGQVVGHVPIRRLNLRPGWESGQKGMRPYTREAREEWERWHERAGESVIAEGLES